MVHTFHNFQKSDICAFFKRRFQIEGIRLTRLLDVLRRVVES